MQWKWSEVVCLVVAEISDVNQKVSLTFLALINNSLNKQIQQKPDHPHRLEDLLRPEVLAAFDRSFFEREGYWVWDGILTDAGRAQWKKSLQKIQAINDAIVTGTDWSAIDYKSRGIADPDPEKITTEFLRSCCGGSEQMAFQPAGMRDYMYGQGLFDPALAADNIAWQGMMPEYFPLAYDDFILDIATAHPQMMQLFAKLLGERFLIDHVLTLNRIPGSRGRRWHAHPYRNKGQHEIEDPTGSGRLLSTDFFQHQCVRTLCYPEGVCATDGGGELALIPGAHLYRIPYLWDGGRTEYDEQIQAGWMRDKIHAFTGEPLRIETLTLPPGSMISFVHHMPHHVGHRDLDAPTRWGLLMAYRTPDPDAEPARWNEGAPAHWVERMVEANQLSASMHRIFKGDNAQKEKV